MTSRTTPRLRGFAQVDVFSSEPFRGNPLAVVLDADGLDEATMQRIARWTNLSETTFLLPPTDPGADYRVRIFTPGGELPFAGHPTLGSAHAWLESGGVPKGARVVQQCASGPIEVRQGDGLLWFAAPPTIRSGPLEPEVLATVVAALGISARDVVRHQWVDNGPGWAVVELASAAGVLALEPDLSGFADGMFGALGAYPSGSAADYELRTFAPRSGIVEDPVCGSMNASVAQWLTRIGAVPDRYTVSQGARLGRAGRITLEREPDGTVWVGGAATTYLRGTALA